MNNQTDQQLLREFADCRSEAAFTELVRRYVDLVYSAAFRMTGEAHSAQDVTQAVFIALVQNATRLTEHPVLSGWLHTTARNLSAKQVRATVRRQTHEQEAAAMNELLATAPDASWDEIAPHLDAALGELSEPDRDAVLLRYFEKKSANEIASTLGVTSEAAQKRVSRSVERLREFFAKRGISVGVGGLAVVISANAVQAAPVGLAVTISAAALAGTTITTATVVAATTQTIAMTTLQKTVITATVAALAGVGIYEAHQAAQLRDQVQALQQQQAPLVEQIQRLQGEYDKNANTITGLKAEAAKNEINNMELLRLRGELAQFRNTTGTRITNSTAPAQNDMEISERQKQIGELMKKANYYQVVEGRLFVMKKRLQLTSEQETLVRHILEKEANDPPNWWSRTLNSEVTAILTQEQKRAAEQWSEEEWQNTRHGAVTTGAGSDLNGLRFWLDLDQSQQTSILPILEDYQTGMYQLEDAKRDTRYSNSFWPVEEELRRKKLDNLKGILSPEQFEIVRGMEEAQIEAGRLLNHDRK